LDFHGNGHHTSLEYGDCAALFRPGFDISNFNGQTYSDVGAADHFTPRDGPD
jgi:hypothetical protein